MQISTLIEKLSDAFNEGGGTDGEVYMLDAQGEMLRITGVRLGLARDKVDGNYVWLDAEYLP